MSSETFSIALRPPYQALSLSAFRFGARSRRSEVTSTRVLALGTTSDMRWAGVASDPLFRESTRPPSDGPARERTEDPDQCDEDQRGAPRLRVTIGVRR